MSKTKRATATEVNKQIKEDKIKRLILKHLKQKKLPVVPDTLKLLRAKVEPAKSDNRQAHVDFEVEAKENGLVSRPEVFGYVLFHIEDMQSGDDLTKVEIYIEWDVRGMLRFGEDQDITKTKK